MKLNTLLEFGFEIKKMKADEFIYFIQNLEKNHLSYYLSNWQRKCCISNGFVYVVTNAFDSDHDLTKVYDLDKVAESEKLTKSYFISFLRKIRLFKNGNICMPFRYYFFFENELPRFIFKEEMCNHVFDEKFILNHSDLRNLDQFIHEPYDEIIF